MLNYQRGTSRPCALGFSHLTLSFAKFEFHQRYCVFFRMLWFIRIFSTLKHIYNYNSHKFRAHTPHFCKTHALHAMDVSPVPVRSLGT